MKYSKLFLILLTCVFSILSQSRQAFALDSENPFFSFVGHYHGEDGNWLHTRYAHFEIKIVNNLPLIIVNNVSQRSDCIARVGAIQSTQNHGTDIHVIYKLEKSVPCHLKADSIRFVFHTHANRCSQRVSGFYPLAETRRDGTLMAYWGLVSDTCD